MATPVVPVVSESRRVPAELIKVETKLAKGELLGEYDMYQLEKRVTGVLNQFEHAVYLQRDYEHKIIIDTSIVKDLPTTPCKVIVHLQVEDLNLQLFYEKHTLVTEIYRQITTLDTAVGFRRFRTPTFTDGILHVETTSRDEPPRVMDEFTTTIMLNSYLKNKARFSSLTTITNHRLIISKGNGNNGRGGYSSYSMYTFCLGTSIEKIFSMLTERPGNRDFTPKEFILEDYEGGASIFVK